MTCPKLLLSAYCGSKKKQVCDPCIEGVYFVTRRAIHMTLFLPSHVLAVMPQDITLCAFQQIPPVLLWSQCPPNTASR